ncbi:MAG: GNAT family N-acetyltransferase [Gammaproteobacteria bacterium]|nr:GNAT family N-acetyltransferase [Gammaproteobacteria bacterium]
MVHACIRQAAEKDASQIAQFNINIAQETEGLALKPEIVESGVIRLLSHPELGFYLVAECESQIVGSLMITTEWSDWRCGQFWWIQSVYVLSDFRRSGLYGRLYSRVKELAESDENVCGFRLYVEKDNTVAQAAYRKYGMHQTAYHVFEETKPGLSYTS